MLEPAESPETRKIRSLRELLRETVEDSMEYYNRVIELEKENKHLKAELRKCTKKE